MSGRDVLDRALRAARYDRPPPPPAQLQRLNRPTKSQFTAFRKTSVPVLLDGIAEQWTTRADWSLGGLRARFADRTISVIVTENGGLKCDAHAGLEFSTVRFGDYVDWLERGERPAVYLAAPSGTWLPELHDDMTVPEYCADAPWHNSRFWLAAPQTSTPLHRDVAENIFVQLAGRKRFLLYPPAAAPWLYSYPLRSALPNYSRVDPEQPDYERFPLSRAVRPLEIVLQPGDALYIPSRWWHHVRSLDVSVSFTFWWAYGALSLAVRAAEFVKRVRGLEIAGLEKRLRAAASS